MARPLKLDQIDYLIRHPYPCSCAAHFSPLGPIEKQEAFRALIDREGASLVQEGYGYDNPHGCWPFLGGIPNGRLGKLFVWYDPAVRRSTPTTVARYAYLLHHGPQSLNLKPEHKIDMRYRERHQLRVTTWCNTVGCVNPEHLVLFEGSTRLISTTVRIPDPSRVREESPEQQFLREVRAERKRQRAEARADILPLSDTDTDTDLEEDKPIQRFFEISSVCVAEFRERLHEAGWARPGTRTPQGVTPYLHHVISFWRKDPSEFRDRRPAAIQDMDWPRSQQPLPLPPIWSPFHVPVPNVLRRLKPLPPDYEGDRKAWKAAVEEIIELEIVQDCWVERGEIASGERRNQRATQIQETKELRAFLQSEGHLKLPQVPSPRKRSSISPLLTRNDQETLEEIRQHFQIPSTRDLLEALAVRWLGHPDVPPPAGGPRKKRGREIDPRMNYDA